MATIGTFTKNENGAGFTGAVYVVHSEAQSVDFSACRLVMREKIAIAFIGRTQTTGNSLS